jgi:adenylate cyclase
MAEQRKIAAILAADVVGYSRLTGADEERTLARLRALRSDLIDPTIAVHRGRVVKRTGDGAIVEFRSVVDAVRCATEVQNAMIERNTGVPPDRRIEFRIGIHLGDVVEESDGDLMGDGVNIAARVEGVAAPGTICLSEDAYRQVKTKIDLAVSDLGETRLKNIADPMRVYSLQVGVPANAKTLPPTEPIARGSGPSLADKPTIAVLPFVSMSKEGEHEYFADGLTEDIITELGRFRAFCVIARNSSFVFKKRSVNVRDIGRELGVQYIVEGSVRHLGKQIRVAAQLVDTTTCKHLWAERFDRDVEDFFSVQDDIVRTIVANLPSHIEGAEHSRILQRPTDNFSAYDHWLRGKHLLHKSITKDQVLAARQHFEKAIKLDPNYASAYVDLAQSYYAEYNSPWTVSREAAAERIFDLSRKAVELDPSDSRTHLELAWSYLNVKGDLDLARAQVEAALTLNPNDYYNYCFGGWLYACSGDLENAVACSNEALRRSPVVSDGCLETRLVAEYLAGNYQGAIMAYGRMVQPDLSVYAWIAAAYAQLGRSEEARAALDAFLLSLAKRSWAPKANDADGWRQYWFTEFRARDQAAREHLFDGLRKAGLLI